MSPSRLLRRILMAVLAVLLTSVAAGCTEDAGVPEDATPEQVLADAKTALDETSGVRLTLATDDLPKGVSGIASADGVAVHPGSFEGKIGLVMAGARPSVPVISIDGTTWAVLPFTTGYQEVDPAEYGAPDPGALVTVDEGLSALLTGTSDVTRGDTIRGGEDNSLVLTEFSGTVPAELVTAVIPQATGDFDVVHAIDEDGRLHSTTMTGQFYPDVATNTYTVTFQEYDVEQEITAP